MYLFIKSYLSTFYFLPINQSLAHIIQFHCKSHDISLISLDWLDILIRQDLLLSSSKTAILGEFQL